MNFAELDDCIYLLPLFSTTVIFRQEGDLLVEEAHVEYTLGVMQCGAANKSLDN